MLGLSGGCTHPRLWPGSGRELLAAKHAERGEGALGT
jgi:hypothetical protein